MVSYREIQCTVVEDNESYETVWFVEIFDKVTTDNKIRNEYSATIIQGQF